MTDLSDLIFYKTGAMSFHDKELPPEVMREVLAASTSCAWLGKWRMLAITDKDIRIKVVEAWQEGLKSVGRLKDVEFVERWKVAPLFVAFVQPKRFEAFTWVSPQYARVYSIQEVGAAIRSMELKALESGVGLHGIMGLLLPEVGDGVKSVLKIPDDQELVFFGIMGYPNETADQKFPKLDEVCSFNSWGMPSAEHQP